MKVYTRKGDDGTTGLYFGGRVPKDSAAPAAYGDVDEAQAALGVARAHTPADGALNDVLIKLERDLWILMADLATDDSNRHKLTPGVSQVTQEMVDHLEELIDSFTERFDMPKEFVVPGQDQASAFLDLARTVVRRAERSSIGAAADGSFVVQYLNRLSDLVWTLARFQEGTAVTARSID